MTAKWIALAATTSVIVACASSMNSQTAAPQTAPRPQTTAPVGSPHDQIEQLSQAIDQQRTELKLPAPSAMTPMVSGSNVPPTVACVRNPSATCSQTCQLSDSICDNAKKICDIAKELPADDWAAKKCSEGNETCSAAKTQCCDCAS